MHLSLCTLTNSIHSPTCACRPPLIYNLDFLNYRATVRAVLMHACHVCEQVLMYICSNCMADICGTARGSHACGRLQGCWQRAAAPILLGLLCGGLRRSNFRLARAPRSIMACLRPEPHCAVPAVFLGLSAQSRPHLTSTFRI